MPVQLEAMADEAEAENDLIDPDTEEETVEQAAPTGDDPIRIVMDRTSLQVLSSWVLMPPQHRTVASI